MPISGNAKKTLAAIIAGMLVAEGALNILSQILPQNMGMTLAYAVFSFLIAFFGDFILISSCEAALSAAKVTTGIIRSGFARLDGSSALLFALFAVISTLSSSLTVWLQTLGTWGTIASGAVWLVLLWLRVWLMPSAFFILRGFTVSDSLKESISAVRLRRPWRIMLRIIGGTALAAAAGAAFLMAFWGISGFRLAEGPTTQIASAISSALGGIVSFCFFGMGRRILEAIVFLTYKKER